MYIPTCIGMSPFPSLPRSSVLSARSLTDSRTRTCRRFPHSLRRGSLARRTWRHDQLRSRLSRSLLYSHSVYVDPRIYIFAHCATISYIIHTYARHRQSPSLRVSSLPTERERSERDPITVWRDFITSEKEKRNETKRRRRPHDILALHSSLLARTNQTNGHSFVCVIHLYLSIDPSQYTFVFVYLCI